MYYLKHNEEYIVITEHASLFSYRDQYAHFLVKFFEGEEKNLVEQFVKLQKKNESKRLKVPCKLVLKDSQATEITPQMYEEVKCDLLEFQTIHELKLKVFRLLNQKLKSDSQVFNTFKKEAGFSYWREEDLNSWFKAETPYTKKVVEKFNLATLIDIANTKQTINLNSFAIHINDYKENSGFVSAHNHAYAEATTISNARLFESVALAQQYINKKSIKNYNIVEVNLNILNVIHSVGRESKDMETIQSLIEKTLIEKQLLSEAEKQKSEIEKLKQLLIDNDLAHLLDEPKVEKAKKIKI